ncbi:hypothetical protein D3C71_1947750 [compost metagenome]
MITMTTKVIIPKVNVSVFRVPADSGMYFFEASNPAMATGPMIGRKRPRINTKPVTTFQKMLLSPRPSKPEPLFAAAEVFSYNISEKPWKPGLFNQLAGLTAQLASGK